MISQLQVHLEESVWTELLAFHELFTKAVERVSRHVQISDRPATDREQCVCNGTHKS